MSENSTVSTVSLNLTSTVTSSTSSSTSTYQSNVTTTAPSNVSNTTTAYSHAEDQTDFYIGLVLAVSSSAFIGASYIIKKIGLMRAAKETKVHASEGSMSYLRDWVWWVGMILMGVGEIANFVAYGYAPAMLVTPLGALSVIVSTVLSSKFLHETLNLFGQSGCVLCLVGSTLIVLNAPQERAITNMEELASMLLDPGFLTYVGLVIAGNCVLIFYCVPRWGRTNPLVYITITGSVGSLTVMSCKSFGVALLQLFAGQTEAAKYWLTWVILVIAGACIALQMNFLNRALDAFNTAIVSTILYIVFTTFVLIASALLFKEWGGLTAAAIVNIVCGFIVIVVAIFLISMFKELKLGWKTLIDFVFKHKLDALNDVVPKSLQDAPPDAANAQEALAADRQHGSKSGKRRKNKARRLSESLSDCEVPIDNHAEPPASSTPLEGSNGSGQLQNGFSNPAFANELTLTLANGADQLAVRFSPDRNGTPYGTINTNGNSVVTRAIVEPPADGIAQGARYMISDETAPDAERRSSAEDPFSMQLEDSGASRTLFMNRSPSKAGNGNAMADVFVMSHAHSLSSPSRITLPVDIDINSSDNNGQKFKSYGTNDSDPRFAEPGYSSRM